eukprot:2546806-Lingulodinium_polyedra.AAC.1
MAFTVTTIVAACGSVSTSPAIAAGGGLVFASTIVPPVALRVVFFFLPWGGPGPPNQGWPAEWRRSSYLWPVATCCRPSNTPPGLVSNVG